MTSFYLSVPSKTFLLGEYVALHKGPTLILATSPRFSLHVKTNNKQDKIEVMGMHTASPAGKFIEDNADFYKKYHLTFIDEHQGLGGFGASSAQFLMVVALKKYITNQRIDDFELLEIYKKFAWDGEGMPPSGADLIAQLHGGICYFYKLKKQIKVFSWPFSDLVYCLIHTENKLATHVHLKKLSLLNTVDLEEIAFAGLISLEEKNPQQFIAAIKNYARLLQAKELVAAHTQAILSKLACNADILAAKGCGALSSDVILIIFKKEKSNHILSWLKQNKLRLINYGYELAHGMKIRKVEEK